MESNDIKLIHGDCLERMKDIADKSVDMVLCDFRMVY
jgi:DNA modification methylase